MANISITEYRELARDAYGNVIAAGREPALARQNVSYTTSTQSSALQGDTHFIRVKADADAYLNFGTNPTATGDSTFVEADVAEFFGVLPGQDLKIAIYDGTS